MGKKPVGLVQERGQVHTHDADQGPGQVGPQPGRAVPHDRVVVLPRRPGANASVTSSSLGGGRREWRGVSTARYRQQEVSPANGAGQDQTQASG